MLERDSPAQGVGESAARPGASGGELLVVSLGLWFGVALSALCLRPAFRDVPFGDLGVERVVDVATIRGLLILVLYRISVSTAVVRSGFVSALVLAAAPGMWVVATRKREPAEEVLRGLPLRLRLAAWVLS